MVEEPIHNLFSAKLFFSLLYSFFFVSFFLFLFLIIFFFLACFPLLLLPAHYSLAEVPARLRRLLSRL